MTESLGVALRRGARQLSEAGLEGGTRDAEVLLRWATGLGAAAMTVSADQALSAEAARKFDAALARRAARSPVSHIVGGREFWGRWFEVTPDVLDPRPETEILVSTALAKQGWRRVLDLGVGSGCLLGALLAERPGATGVGVDISDAALRVAGRNLTALGVVSRADLINGDWLDCVAGAFDLVVCNPPYITQDEMRTLSPEVALHEPHIALSPGGDGLTPFRRIASQLRAVLAPDHLALFEIGPLQADAVVAIFMEAGFRRIDVRQDFDGRDRCVAICSE